MGSEISLFIGFLAALIEEAGEDANEVFLLLLLVTPLDRDEVLNPAAVVLQDAVDQQQCEGYQLLLALHLLYDLEEQTDVVFWLPVLYQLLFSTLYIGDSDSLLIVRHGNEA
jgi:hypothetical protein